MTMQHWRGVEIKRQGQERILESLKDLTRSQQLTYWHKATEELRKSQQTLRNQGTRLAIEFPERQPRSASSDLGDRVKSFDCIAIQRQGAEQILAQLTTMSREEQLAYWQAGTEALRQRQQALRSQNKSAAIGSETVQTMRSS